MLVLKKVFMQKLVSNILSFESMNIVYILAEKKTYSMIDEFKLSKFLLHLFLVSNI